MHVNTIQSGCKQKRNVTICVCKYYTRLHISLLCRTVLGGGGPRRTIVSAPGVIDYRPRRPLSLLTARRNVNKPTATNASRNADKIWRTARGFLVFLLGCSTANVHCERPHVVHCRVPTKTDPIRRRRSGLRWPSCSFARF